MRPFKTGEKVLWYTLGPKSLGVEADMFLNGATGVRLTFNFGTPELQLGRAIYNKKVAAEQSRFCYVVADLGGEKYRLGTFREIPTIFVAAGSTAHLICADSSAPSSDNLILPVPDARFFSLLDKSSTIIIGDGAATIEITSVSGNEATGEITENGVIDHTRGLTIQGGDFRPCALTSKDLDDLYHIMSFQAYDAVAISFVSSEADVFQVRKIAKTFNREISIIAKIETLAAIENIHSICRAADCVLAARGDLALAIPWVELPSAVDQIASAAESNSTPWILATQIAEGLERFYIPSRAEICDLAHWLGRGCAGVLLSYETAFGAKPQRAVSCIAELLARWGK